MPDASKPIDVPGVGKVKKVYVGAAVVGVALVGVLWYRSRQNAQAASAVASAPVGTTATDADGNVCSTLDPNSGYCPGTPNDQAYYSGQLSYADTTAGGGIVGYDDTGAPIYSSSGLGVTAVTGPGSFSNNAEWASYCEAQMGSNGADPIAAALGKYLVGGGVTAEQIVTIDEAIAIGGNPPTQGAGGRPPGINQIGGSGGTTPPPATKVTVPNVVGETVNAAHAKLTSAGLTFNPDTAKDKPGDIRKVTGQNPKSGAKVAKGTKVSLTWNYEKG